MQGYAPTYNDDASAIPKKIKTISHQLISSLYQIFPIALKNTFRAAFFKIKIHTLI